MIESVGCGRFAVSKRNLGMAKKTRLPSRRVCNFERIIKDDKDTVFHTCVSTYKF